MAMRTISADEEQWEWVADHVTERRDNLNLTAAEVSDRAGRGLSLAVLSQIENHRKTSYSVRTISALERALNWMPNSVQRILDGNEPEEVWQGPTPQDEALPPAEEPTSSPVLPDEWDEPFAELERRLAAVEAAQKADREADREERDRLEDALLAEITARQQLARRIEQTDAKPWLTIEPDPSNEDEMKIWAMERRTEEWRQRIIWEVRKGPDPDDDDEDEAARTNLAG